ncbi:hypothetical protein [Selenomonas ruminantium]|jgi:hypothetical protein|uniref:hypothetical protein n=1 Tax=Selenomonas ruminantium TaxID=971 RepID=UPI001160F83A|nr:hypothetical protein [Selenomonas ruminantium]
MLPQGEENAVGGLVSLGFMASGFWIGYKYYKKEHDKNYNACIKNIKFWKNGYKCMRCGEEFSLPDNKSK